MLNVCCDVFEVTAASDAPSLYLLNANSLVKRHASTHLASDVHHYQVDVAVITESHLNRRHPDSLVAISGYRLLRRDRTDRPGGGVAIYARRQVLPLTSSLTKTKTEFGDYRRRQNCVHKPNNYVSIMPFLDYFNLQSVINIRVFIITMIYVAVKATYIRLLHGKIGILEGFFGPSSVHRGRTHIVLG